MKNNLESSRFERDVNGVIVHAAYRLDGKTLSITYVEAPPELRGSGEAGKLMQEVMDYAREQGLKVVPICGYAASWIRRHPEVQDLLA